MTSLVLTSIYATKPEKIRNILNLIMKIKFYLYTTSGSFILNFFGSINSTSAIWRSSGFIFSRACPQVSLIF